MRHYYVLQSLNVSATYFSSKVTANTLDSFKEYLPDLVVVKLVAGLAGGQVESVCFLFVLLRGVVGHVLEHADGCQVVIDVVSCVGCVHVDRIQDCDKVLLAQPIDIVANDKLETSEALCDYLVTLMF